MSKINIFVDVEDRLGITSFYRASRPLALLRHLGMDLNLIYHSLPVSWDILSSIDIFFSQRPRPEQCLSTIRLCKDMRIPIWLDWDDDVFSVPPSHDRGGYNYFSRPETKHGIQEMLTLADVVTVTTEAILKSFIEWNFNVRIIPNAFDDLLLKGNPPKETNKIIVHRGTWVHAKEMAMVGSQYGEVLHRNTDWRGVFFGYLHWMILPYIPKDRVEFIEWIPHLRFFDKMREIAGAIHIVPLWPDDFNNAKSNIAWLESTWCGSVCIAPQWDEWIQPGVYCYRDPQSFGQALQYAIDRSSTERRNDNLKSWDCIQEKFLLSKINRQRKELIEGLYERTN